ncbi:MAG TPA: hypothetical protein VGM31_05390 [Puia sp.]
MRSVVYGLFLGLVLPAIGFSQNYHAVEGTPDAGSMGVANNPASILSSPYPWDLTIFSVQVKNTTNAVVLHNFSLIPSVDTIGVSWNKGYFKRYAAFNYNVHLLNARIALGQKQAIAFGANLRGYSEVRTGPAAYLDTLQDMNQFFNINEGTVYEGNMTSSSWLELFATYSRTVWDDEYRRINAGVTLKAMRGVSGLYAQLSDVTAGTNLTTNEPSFVLKSGGAQYGYSSNFDRWKNSRTAGENLKDIFANSRAGAAIDLGLEYWVKSEAVTNRMDEDTWYDYEWKIGISLLDVGWNSYRYGTQSRAFSQPRTTATDSILNTRFSGLKSLADFNDSLATIMNNVRALTGLYKIYNPMRLVINVDRPLQNDFAINGNLPLNAPIKSTSKRLIVKDFSMLVITPRWEKKKLGAYLPLQVTTDGRFWVGGAFKAGPLLMGIHNWANLFSKSKMQNGGFYIALVVRPGHGAREKEDQQYTCPPGQGL